MSEQGTLMARLACNFQDRKATSLDRLSAVAADNCAHCGISLARLGSHGAAFEVCADEYLLDESADARAYEVLALCPTCHAEHHRDVVGRHNPCPFKARRSRESLGR
jgi:hypothetical protein